MQASTFMSSHFNTEDSHIIERVKNRLKICGVFSVQIENSPESFDTVMHIIQQLELYCAVLTSGTSEESRLMISREVGVALANQKKVIIFRDKMVPVQTNYPEKLQIEYDRDTILNSTTDHIELDTKIKVLLKLYGIHPYKNPIENGTLKRFEFAKEQAQILGGTILRFYNDVFYQNQVRNKSIKNYPTKADITANKIIKSEIKKKSLFKDDNIISEEDIKDPNVLSNLLFESGTSTRYTWVIDPLDGTLNFAYNFPYFCVSIGVLKDNEPVIGVVYNPTTQELYCGLKGTRSECIDLRSGQKKYLNTGYSKSDLEDCIVMTHLSTHEKPRLKTIAALNSIMNRCRNVRMLGSGQMSLVSIALGQFDVFFNYSTNIWDIIPGAVILSGAGGYISSSLNQDSIWDLHSKGILAARTASIGRQMRKLLLAEFATDFPHL